MVRANRGFTIVELLIVIVVLGVLSTIIIVASMTISQRAHNETMVADLRELAMKLNSYKLESGTWVYPPAITDVGEDVDTEGVDYVAMNWASPANFCVSLTRKSTSFHVNRELEVADGICPDVTAVVGDAVVTATTNSTSQITVSWGSISGAVSYRIEYSPDESFVNNVQSIPGLTTTSRAITGLTPGTVYFFRVYVTNSGGEGYPSNMVGAITRSVAPVIAASASSTTQVMVTWNPVAGASSYRLQYSTSSTFASGVQTIDDITSTNRLVSSVSSGTTYYFRVYAINSGGSSAASNTANATTRPASPSISVTTNSSSQVTVNWGAVTGATSYRLQYSTSSSFSGATTLNSLTGTSRTVTGLSPGTTYYFRMYAINSGGTSAASTVVSAITRSVAPVVTVTANSTSQITVSWTSSAGAASYRLQYATNSGFTSGLQTVNGLTGNSNSITGLTAGTTYYFRMYAVNAGGDSAASSTVSIATRPLSPSISVTTNSTSQLTANWGAVSGATDYRLQYSTSSTFASGVTTFADLTSTSRAVTGLNAGTTYYFRVYASNASGDSAASATASAITHSVAPAISATTNSTSQITVTWGAVSGAASYRLQYATNSGFSSGLQTVNGVTGTSRAVTGLSAGTTYYFRMYSINTGGTSAASNVDNATTRSVAPSISVATNSSTQVTVNWGAVTGAASYKLQYATNSGFTTGLQTLTGLSGTSRAVTSLAAGTTYYFRLYAVNAGGDSSPSATISALTRPATASLSATTNSTSQITVNWGAVTSATSYRFQYATNSGFTTGLQTINLTGTSQAVTGLSAGTTYYFRVYASNASGEGGASSVISAITRSVAPSISATTNSTSQITVNWGAVAGAASYKLQYSTSSTFASGVTTLNGLSGTSRAVTGLSAGSNYYFRIYAVNTGGESAASATVSAYTRTAAPSISATTNSSTQITVNWGAVAGAASYQLQYATNSSFTSPTTLNGLTGTSRAVTGLATGTTYYFRMYAINTGGTSAVSNTVSTITRPAAPSISATTNSTTQITANWGAVTGATAYRLQRATNSGFTTGVVTSSGLTTTSQAATGLAAGTTYYFRVYASNAGGEGVASATVSAITVPAAPTVSLTANSTSQLTASWSAVTGASQYRLQYATNSGFTAGLQTVDAVTGTSRAITGLAAGTTYYVRMYTINTGGTSAASATVSRITRSVAPSISATTNSASQVTVNWGAVTSATSYKLQHATNSSFTSPTTLSGLTDTSRAVTGLAAGTTHYFRLYAVNASGDSAASATVSALTRAATPIITATVNSASQVTVNWGAVTSATSYKLQHATNSSFTSPTTLSGLTGTSRAVTGLAAGTTHYFRLYAVNASGDSAASSVASALTRSAAPSISASGVSASQITANWGAVTGAASYKLQYATNSGFTTGLQTLTGLTGTSRAVTGLAAATTYYLRIYAVNASGDSVASSTVSAITRTATPSISSATVNSASQVTLTWGAVSGATSYKIQRATNSAFSAGLSTLTGVTGTSRAVTGLAAGTTYYFRMFAVNSSGDSATSGTVSRLTRPAVPSISVVSNSTSQITINWSAVSTATSYRIQRATNSAFSSGLTTIDSVTGSSRAITGLAAGTTYYFRMYASNGSGMGGASSTATTATRSAAPSISATVNSGTQITISWSAVTGATSYRLQRATNSAFTAGLVTTNGVTGTSQAVTGLATGSTYYFRMYSSNAGGLSGASNTVSGSTTPNSPTNVTANMTSTNGTTSFTATCASGSTAQFRSRVTHRADGSFADSWGGWSGFSGTASRGAFISQGRYGRVNVEARCVIGSVVSASRFARSKGEINQSTANFPYNFSRQLPNIGGWAGNYATATLTCPSGWTSYLHLSLRSRSSGSNNGTWAPSGSNRGHDVTNSGSPSTTVRTYTASGYVWERGNVGSISHSVPGWPSNAHNWVNGSAATLFMRCTSPGGYLVRHANIWSKTGSYNAPSNNKSYSWTWSIKSGRPAAQSNLTSA